ncbi:hypothetical protein RHSIM_Rhsim04G0025600 [Rhododendron simsii]|uniref:Pollen Ole e 1 allergen and extensin family protein n=1 Tax=Rhododendron simsii TaxID=118357 RepID=A0A834H301_RHOSS|nr:hypothetical protein RHSIM_Rhsim04G0025600 [Rhododendron simsii]
MAKAVALIAFALALGVLAIAGNVQGSNVGTIYASNGKFKVELKPVKKFRVIGYVACATCIANSTMSDLRRLRSADFEIKCRSRKNGTVTFVKPALSDSSGLFTAYVEDGHHDDLCMVSEVRAVASRDPRCNVKAPGFRSARITVANYNANKVNDNMLQIQKPMYFLNNEALHNCGKARSKKGDLNPKNEILY